MNELVSKDALNEDEEKEVLAFLALIKSLPMEELHAGNPALSLKPVTAQKLQDIVEDLELEAAQ